MLDIMRKKKRMKAIVLWITIIAVGGSMVVWGVALNLGGNSNSSASNAYAAMVDDRPILMKDFLTTYRQNIEGLKNSAQGADLDPELLKSLGLSQQVLNRLIRGKVVEILAENLGISVTPNELRQAIMSLPGLQIDGKFVGLEQYKLALANAGYSVETFEEEMWYDTLSIKLTRVITDSLEISDEEIREEFSRINQTTMVEYVLLENENFKKKVKPTDSELQAYFEENKEKYTIQEKRQAEYLLIPTSPILSGIQVSDEEIQDEWNKNPLPETVEAAHILFLVKDPAQEEEVRNKAESVLKQVQAGGDFAELAKKYSEDTSNASEGGYLGPFQRGQTGIKEFEDAAFSLQPGEVSGLIRSPDFGFQIIKVLRHDIPTLEANSNDLYTTIQLRKAKDAAKQKAEEAAGLAADRDALDSIGKELGITAEINKTGPFSKDENPYSLGISQALSDDIFNINEVGSLGKVVEHTLGYAFARLEEIQVSRPAEFQESIKQVENDYVDSKTKELMSAEAQKISEDAAQQNGLAEVARKSGYQSITSPNFKIDESPGLEIPDMNAFNAVAFQLEPGSVSQPIPMSDTTAVLEVKSRSPFDEAAFETEKDALHDQMNQSLQSGYLEDYFNAFSEELEASDKITINPEAFNQVDRLRF